MKINNKNYLTLLIIVFLFIYFVFGYTGATNEPNNPIVIPPVG